MENKEEEVGTLIILHGWNYSIEKWKPFLKLLKRHGVEYEMLKIPGLTAPLSRVWTLDDYVSWLNEQIANGQKPIAILGHSNGGRIAAAFTAKNHGKVSKLILIDSAGIIHRDLKTVLKKNLFTAITRIGKKITTSDSIRNLLYKVAGEQDYNKANPILKKTMLNLISQDLESTFSKITIPTLIVWGENDEIVPISQGRKIKELIAKSTLEIIENARHSPQFTNPEDTVKIITKFINL